jgi:hypothetical protein
VKASKRKRRKPSPAEAERRYQRRLERLGQLRFEGW